jgi:drug/metabolite transporter (DMT)-like permease
MTNRLSLTQIAVLLVYAAGMAGGQLLFKMAAFRFAADVPIGQRVLTLLQNGFFLAAVILYAGLAVLWVWVLSFTPLSRAYPFVAFAFAITPILGGLVFAEPVTLRLVGGIVLILCGLVLIVG